MNRSNSVGAEIGMLVSYTSGQSVSQLYISGCLSQKQHEAFTVLTNYKQAQISRVFCEQCSVP